MGKLRAWDISFLWEKKLKSSIGAGFVCTPQSSISSSEDNLLAIVLGCHIQDVTGGTDQTSGECSLGQTIPI